MYAHVRVKVLENICIICICCHSMTGWRVWRVNYESLRVRRLLYIRMYAGRYFRKHPSYPSSVIESHRAIAISINDCKSIYIFCICQIFPDYPYNISLLFRHRISAVCSLQPCHLQPSNLSFRPSKPAVCSVQIRHLPRVITLFACTANGKIIIFLIIIFW